MNAIRFLVNYSWIALFPICLASFVPLALNADVVGGIPSWGYWMLSLISMAAFLASSAASGLYSWYTSRHAMGA